jgi:UDP-glucose 4-epimerase
LNTLLTDGAGYIGSHNAIVLSEASHEVVLFDNFYNGPNSVLEQLQKILGGPLLSVDDDVRYTYSLTKMLQEYKIEAVIYFAGLKVVGESIEKSIEHYANHMHGTTSLLEAMKSAGIKTLVYSSSITVYGHPQYLPTYENNPTTATIV